MSEETWVWRYTGDPEKTTLPDKPPHMPTLEIEPGTSGRKPVIYQPRYLDSPTTRRARSPTSAHPVVVV